MNSTIPPPRAKKTDALVGTVVAGKFKVLSLVAAGGMGKVYRAEQMPLGRTVALKVLHVHSSDDVDGDDPQFKKRFLREASILAKLQHPNIVTVFDYGAIEGEHERYFMAMEFLSGETLTRRISERVSLGATETIKIARQLARGLTEAHASGVIHRDLKPSNVMLLPERDGDDLVKIVDFGIVKLIGEDSQEMEELTQEGSFIGSPKYMAPEQITRGGKIDARTDIYSFGVILYQCLTGTVPFEGSSSVQTLMAHLNQTPQPMRERCPSLDVPDWLEQLVVACMEKDPELRPQTMEGVARRLADAEAVLNSTRVLAGTRTSQPAANAANAASYRPTHRSGSDTLTAAPGHGAGSEKSISITTQGTIASVNPPGRGNDDKTRTSPGIKREAPGPSRASYALGGVAVLAVLALLVAFLRPRGPDPAASSAASGNVQPSALPPARDEFALTIESSPSGADVREGDRVLGTTPLLLTIDNDTTRGAPRAFTIVKEGYSPYALTQGSSQESVRLVAPLTALPAATPSAIASSAPTTPTHGAVKKPGASSKGSTPSPSSAPASKPDLDIRMNR